MSEQIKSVQKLYPPYIELETICSTEGWKFFFFWGKGWKYLKNVQWHFTTVLLQLHLIITLPTVVAFFEQLEGA